MDVSLKAQILVWIFICGVVLLALLLIMYTLGNMSNLLERLESVVDKESLVRYEKLELYASRETHARKVEEERRRRSEALLAMPLVGEKGENWHR